MANNSPFTIDHRDLIAAIPAGLPPKAPARWLLRRPSKDRYKTAPDLYRRAEQRLRQQAQSPSKTEQECAEVALSTACTRGAPNRRLSARKDLLAACRSLCSFVTAYPLAGAVLLSPELAAQFVATPEVAGLLAPLRTQLWTDSLREAVLVDMGRNEHFQQLAAALGVSRCLYRVAAPLPALASLNAACLVMPGELFAERETPSATQAIAIGLIYVASADAQINPRSTTWRAITLWAKRNARDLVTAVGRKEALRYLDRAALQSNNEPPASLTRLVRWAHLSSCGETHHPSAGFRPGLSVRDCLERSAAIERIYPSRD